MLFSRKGTLLALLLFFSLIGAVLAQPNPGNIDDNVIAETAIHDEADEASNNVLDWELIYIGDGIYGFSGPYDNQSTLLDNVLLNLTVDTQKLAHIKGNSLFFTVLGIWGGSPDNVIRSAQDIDNIEDNYKTALLYQAWTEQKLLDDHLAVLFGLYDFNSEFAVTDSALVFIMPPMGTPAEIAQSGLNGPSTYPVTSLAGRIKITPNDHWYMMLAAFDGVPGNPNHPYGTHIDLVKNNGLFWVTEHGLNLGTENRKYKLAVGGWFYTRISDDLLGLGASRNHGLYGMIDIPVYRASEDSARGINVFFRPGIANNLVNQFSAAYGGGVHWLGPFVKRPDDETGIAFSYAISSNDYVLASTPGALLNETLVEVTYLAKINEHLVLQSSLEWVLPKNQSAELLAEQQTFIGIFRIKTCA